MSVDADRSAFGTRLGAIFRAFDEEEARLRKEYARAAGTASPPSELLERPTRRFLVDEMLKALNWDVGDSRSVLEEARAKGDRENWLFFDYLGMRPGTRAPVLLVEAKRFDQEPPRRARSATPSSEEMSRILVEAIDALHRDTPSDAVVSAWADYLRDLRDYVRSLDSPGAETLGRVVITAGRWLVIFSEPLATFGQTPKPEVAHVHCFVDRQDMLDGAGRLFELLYRPILVDTLPLTLSMEEALVVLGGRPIDMSFRAVLVATSGHSGAKRVRYPTRTAYPALVLNSGGRLLAVVDYEARTEEPEELPRLAAYIERLRSLVERHEERLRTRLGGLPEPSPISAFQGFAGPADATVDTAAATYRTQSPTSWAASGRRRFAIGAHGDAEPGELLLVTGHEHFYKTPAPLSDPCPFHSWRAARDDGAAAGSAAQESVRPSSFTVDGEPNHCAHSHMLALRRERCRIDVVEERLCCWTCLYKSDCWTDEAELGRLPCTTPARGI